MRYRGDGSPRSTSSTTPERDRRSVDSDSATTCLPTSKAIATLIAHAHRGPTPPDARYHRPPLCTVAWCDQRDMAKRPVSLSLRLARAQARDRVYAPHRFRVDRLRAICELRPRQRSELVLGGLRAT